VITCILNQKECAEAIHEALVISDEEATTRWEVSNTVLWYFCQNHAKRVLKLVLIRLY